MTYDQWKTDSGYAEKTPEQENEGRDCCADGCQYAAMVGMPEYRCADGCRFDPPRRCETSLVGGLGECLACDAAQGQHCLNAKI